MSKYCAVENQSWVMSRPGERFHRMTRRSGSRYGNGRSSNAFATLKMAVLAPIPIASESSVAAVNPGERRKPRTHSEGPGRACTWREFYQCLQQPASEALDLLVTATPLCPEACRRLVHWPETAFWEITPVKSGSLTDRERGTRPVPGAGLDHGGGKKFPRL